MQQFKNLVFDLGEVIIDIDYRKTIAAFQQLAVVEFSQVVSYTAQDPVFDLFEKGKVNRTEFYNSLRKFLHQQTTDKQIEDAWNAIFEDFPVWKIELLRKLKHQYRTFALSNINEIHLDTINRVARQKFDEPDFGNLFHGAYYSNLLGYRKPDNAIYELVMTNEGLVPHQTFFVDDKKENVEAAKKLGWQAYQLTDRNKLEDLLAELKII